MWSRRWSAARKLMIRKDTFLRTAHNFHENTVGDSVFSSKESCGWIGEGNFVSSPARMMILRAVVGVMGPSRSVTNKYGEAG